MKALSLLMVVLTIIACQSSDSYKIKIGEDFNHQVDKVDLSNESKLFKFLSPEETLIDFTNQINETNDFNYYSFSYIYNGGGVAVGDINNDGLPDLYFIGNMVPNKLYLNQGNFKFKDITLESGTEGGRGFKTGATMVDINGDGLLDIYVCKSGRYIPEYRENFLYINNGDLTFTERAKEYGLNDNSYSSQAYFVDIDNDGDLDCYMVNHPIDPLERNIIRYSMGEKGEFIPQLSDDLEYITDKLYLNQNGIFVDITEKAGLVNEAFGLSAIIADFNDDLLPDIYVCNDYIKPDYLYINNGNNTFTESFHDFMFQTAFSSMGSDYSDFNNDGCMDLMVLDMRPPNDFRRKMLGTSETYDKYLQMIKAGFAAQLTKNALQLNNCNGSFSEIAYMAGVDATDWSWTVLFADLDNSGWKDLLVTNGFFREVSNIEYTRYQADSLKKVFLSKNISFAEWMDQIPRQKTVNHLFRNNRDFTFSDVSEIWDAGPPSYSSGGVYVDLDNDGYLDLVVSNLEDPVFIMKNIGKENRGNNFIRFDLKDPSGKTCYGAQILLHDLNGTFQMQHFYPTRGFLSSVEPIIHFGIGKNTSVDRVEVIWPDGTVQILQNPEINKVNKIQKEPSKTKYTKRINPEIYFEDISGKLGAEAVHIENPYIDFKREPLLIRKLSEEGPASAVGDVNGDGLDDFYLGGSVGEPGKLFIQQQNGSFSLVNQAVFNGDQKSEDVASVFFDFNGNGYLDLYVVSGGNEYPAYAPEYVDRLYINDGKGNFTKTQGVVPTIPSSGGCVTVSDINGDGKPDLFVGGRVVPGSYPKAPVSMLLVNEGGKLVNKAADYSSELMSLGMITDAQFADLDKDGIDELIVCGEWLPVTVFKKDDKGGFTNITKDLGLHGITGWWYSLQIGDLNGDGYPEIIAGNLGLNNPLRPKKDYPVKVYAADFDDNGSMDAIVTYHDGEKDTPYLGRDKLLDQMIVLKKKYLRYESYAKSGINEILGPDMLKKAKILEANSFVHQIFVNNGGNSFSNQPMLQYTQISPIRSTIVYDINGNGHLDLLIGGNEFGTDIEIGPFDASVGAVLLGDSQLNFSVMRPGESGFFIPGNVRKIHPLKSKNETLFLVTRNDDSCSLFRLKKPVL